MGKNPCTRPGKEIHKRQGNKTTAQFYKLTRKQFSEPVKKLSRFISVDFCSVTMNDKLLNILTF